MNNEILTNIRAAVTADVDAAVAANSKLRLMGWSARDGASAASTIDIVNGATGAAAGKVVRVNVAAAGDNTYMFPGDGIGCPLGISVDFLTGDVDLILYYKFATTT